MDKPARGRALRVDPDALVLTLLHQFSATPHRLNDFLETTGLQAGALRAGLADGSLRAALFHYVLGHEDLLLEAAAVLGCPPEAVVGAAGALNEDRPGSTEP